MATSKEYLAFILHHLAGVEGITHRMMMGEYILYHHGKVAAYLCDDRLLVKSVPSAVQKLPNARQEPPYAGAKDMLLVEQVADRAFLKELFEAMYAELPAPRPRKKR